MEVISGLSDPDALSAAPGLQEIRRSGGFQVRAISYAAPGVEVIFWPPPIQTP
jgi:hypothetical protein